MDFSCTATEGSSSALISNRTVFEPGCPTPGLMRTRTGTMRVPAFSTSTTVSDATKADSIPLTPMRYRRGDSALLIICRRYTFSIIPSSTSRPSVPRSRITSTFSGTRVSMWANSATVTPTRIAE